MGVGNFNDFGNWGFVLRFGIFDVVPIFGF